MMKKSSQPNGKRLMYERDRNLMATMKVLTTRKAMLAFRSGASDSVDVMLVTYMGAAESRAATKAACSVLFIDMLFDCSDCCCE